MTEENTYIPTIPGRFLDMSLKPWVVLDTLGLPQHVHLDGEGMRIAISTADTVQASKNIEALDDVLIVPLKAGFLVPTLGYEDCATC
jgi:hypothetical protein